MYCQSEPLRQYDVVVCGGGLVGLAAAGCLARSGRRVLLVERRGRLGWEVTGARRIHLPLEDIADQSFAAESWLERLGKLQAYRDGLVDPSFAELAFERWAVDIGIDLLFQCWPVRALIDSDGKVNALRLGTRVGYLEIGAGVIIDAADYPRIATSCGWRITPGVASVPVLPLLFSNVSGSDIAKSLELELNSGQRVILQVYPTLWPHECQVDVWLSAQEGEDMSDLSIGEVVEAVARKVKAHIPDFEKAILSYIGDELWRWPSFSLENLTEGEVIARTYPNSGMEDECRLSVDTTFSLSISGVTNGKGIIAVGNWLLSDKQRKLQNLVLLGDLAAKLVIRDLGVGQLV